MSGREDLNLRPPAPKAGALTRLRYAPNKYMDEKYQALNLTLDIYAVKNYPNDFRNLSLSPSKARER